MSDIKKLQDEIERKKLELELLTKSVELSRRLEVVKPLEEYTDSEKINAFNKLYNSALGMLLEKEKHGYSNEDNSQYTWEEVMQLLAKDSNKFWKYYNSL